MALLTFPTKDPADIIDLVIDWSRYLGTEDKIIRTSATLEVKPPGELILRDTLVTGAFVRCWCEGGVANRTYNIICTVQTEGGRTVQRTAQLPVAEL